MDYIKHLREERVAAYEKAKEILDRAGSESRNLDAEERQSVDRAFAHMDDLKARETDFRSLQDREQEIEAAQWVEMQMLRDALAAAKSTAAPSGVSRAPQNHDLQVPQPLAIAHQLLFTCSTLDLAR